MQARRCHPSPAWRASMSVAGGTPPPPRGEQTPSPAMLHASQASIQQNTSQNTQAQQHTPPPSCTPAVSPAGAITLSSSSATSPPLPPATPVLSEQTSQTSPSVPVTQCTSAPSNDDDLSQVRLRRTNTEVSARVRHYLRRETSLFFGVCQDEEREQRRLWRERRRRHATRLLGPLKHDAPVDTDDEEIDSPRVGVMFPDGRPDVLPGGEPVSSRVTEVPSAVIPPRGKDSVARLTMTGLSYVVAAMTRSRARASAAPRTWSRSFPASEDVRPGEAEEEEGDDEVFFAPPPRLPDDVDTSKDVNDGHTGASEEGVEWRRGAGDGLTMVTRGRSRVSWGTAPSTAAATRMSPTLIDTMTNNSDRRQYGLGVVGKLFRRSLRRSVARQEDVARQLDAITDYRPYFTWWVSFVQLVVLILSIACYGFGPVGFGRASRSGQVLVTSLSLQQVDYQEPAGFWLGPRAADLIHVGAKFAVCMRRDARISRDIAAGARRERDTACCIRNDDSGCVQSSQADCSNTISTWKKWSAGAQGPGGRISGSVCGLDPKFCEAPASVAPYEWPDDITKWPICRKSSVRGAIRGAGTSGSVGNNGGGVSRRLDKTAEHMACEVIGHPCCIGVYGHCRITTREYCDFVKGYFHEEASLCSQVSCLDDVCGMLPFAARGRPDQFYRLWTSLFVHAGILHLASTLVLQWLLMRDLEKLTGPLRVAVIYIGSGVAGNLASAIFMPYRAEVGPAGAHFGLLACLLAEVVHSWKLLRAPRRAAARLLGIAGALFIIGLLPWIDNYAQFFGFVFGFLLSYALLPYVTFGPYDRRKKIVLIWTCLVSAGLLFALLVILFYVVPVYECEWCSYFNCIPFTEDFCSSQNINFKREEPVV